MKITGPNSIKELLIMLKAEYPTGIEKYNKAAKHSESAARRYLLATQHAANENYRKTVKAI